MIQGVDGVTGADIAALQFKSRRRRFARRQRRFGSDPPPHRRCRTRATGDPRHRFRHHRRTGAIVSTTNSLDLYSLLPAVYRIRDAERGYSLRAFLGLVSGQAQVLKADIDGLWDDLFIETCAGWVIPYIGDLVANNPLPEGVVRRRADAARTIYYRRRKGTADHARADGARRHRTGGRPCRRLLRTARLDAESEPPALPHGQFHRRVRSLRLRPCGQLCCATWTPWTASTAPSTPPPTPSMCVLPITHRRQQHPQHRLLPLEAAKLLHARGDAAQVFHLRRRLLFQPHRKSRAAVYPSRRPGEASS